MKYIVVIVCMCFAFAKANAACMQNYQQHIVAQGETIYTLTRMYKVTSQDLLSLNPDLKSGLKYGQVLLIPAPNKVLTQRKIKKYKSHHVGRKETLYSLSKKYEITELDIKESNKELYSNPLRKGDRIQIPVFEDIEITLSKIKEVVSDPANLPDGKYLVKPSEGMYRIASKYGIKVDSLHQLNPEVGALRPGMILNVPKNVSLITSEDNDNQGPVTPAIEDNQMMQYVLPNNMSMYLLKKVAGVSEDSLISLNPQLKEGLQEGMSVIIPNPNYGKVTDLKLETSGVARLVDSLNNFKKQRLAIMLPFSLQKIDETTSDRDNLKSDRTMRIALDFYSGLKIAIDSANALGIPVIYDVFDTQKNIQTTQNILKQTDFTEYNTVIGPLMSINVVETAKELKDKGIPVISPLTNTEVRLYRNLFQARPSDQVLKEKLQEYLATYAVGKNVIIITDNDRPELKKEFTSILPGATVLVPNTEKNYIYSAEYSKKLKSDTENVIVLAIENEVLITDAVVNYAAKTAAYQITMFGLENFEDMGLSNTKLASLNYIFPRMFKESDTTNSFIEKYVSIHKITPNSYATRGFDVTLDIIFRQASAADLYESAFINAKTMMTENKFDYSKKFFSGFYNDAIYMLQYQEDLSIKELHINAITKEL
ncbi:LysM peptidoglycan-binding domain-containing protein [Nonlabens sp.]|uniref:LysM peptidoglycan-binding domain-containing protein n=1 Tax=Nonlabens sp. TaxID=1888209 RepID=UPI0025F7397E|nr:LysM peptidoglycan-binding domain-containing protein [Nonlabens sp.]